MGAQELQFPALLPREPYEATGRWTEYGDGIFRLKDRKGGDYLLGPTHEELFTLVVKDLYSSYKDLPRLALPDPDEVPRRGAAPRRHPARPRVRDEGLLLLRHLRRRAWRSRTPPTARPTSRPSTGSASTTSSSRPPPARWAARCPRSSSPPPRTARTPTSAASTCDYAANVEAVQVRPPAPLRVRRRARRPRRADPGHPDHRDARRPPQRRVPPRRPALARR